MIIRKGNITCKYNLLIQDEIMLPRQMWLMTAYEVSLTAVEGVERKDISWAVYQIWADLSDRQQENVMIKGDVH